MILVSMNSFEISQIFKLFSRFFLKTIEETLMSKIEFNLKIFSCSRKQKFTLELVFFILLKINLIL